VLRQACCKHHVYRGLAVTSRYDVIDGRPPYWRYFFRAKNRPYVRDRNVPMHLTKPGLRHQDLEGIHLPSFRFSWKLKKLCWANFFVFESWQTAEDVMVVPCDFTAVCSRFNIFYSALDSIFFTQLSIQYFLLSSRFNIFYSALDSIFFRERAVVYCVVQSAKVRSGRIWVQISARSHSASLWPQAGHITLVAQGLK
jgi:hypothetical protein